MFVCLFVCVFVCLFQSPDGCRRFWSSTEFPPGWPHTLSILLQKLASLLNVSVVHRSGDQIRFRKVPKVLIPAPPPPPPPPVPSSRLGVGGGLKWGWRWVLNFEVRQSSSAICVEHWWSVACRHSAHVHFILPVSARRSFCCPVYAEHVTVVSKPVHGSSQ